MKRKEDPNEASLPINQVELFLYNKYFAFFLKLYKNDLLPSKILLTGQQGIGKSTFAYHFINFILSVNEEYKYDVKKFLINPLNKSFRLINQHCHPNFYLIQNSINKRNIDVKQIRDLISYLNKTTYKNKKKIVLIDNAEYLNISSVNALLKITEEPNYETLFIFVHNSSKKLIETLKSRCISFNIFFSYHEKKKILDNLLTCYKINISKSHLEKIISVYDSPGSILNILKVLNENFIDIYKLNLIELIVKLMDFNLKNKNITNLDILQNVIELFFFKKLIITNNKTRILLKYSYVIKKLNFFRKYNIDMNNIFYEIKEEIIHA